VSRALELAALLGLLAVGLLIARGRAKLAVVGWLCILCFVPVWMGVEFKIFLLPTVVAAVAVLAVVLPVRMRSLSMADLLVAFFAVVCLVPLVIGGASGSFVAVLILQWLLAFSLGRIVPLRVDLRWIYGAIAVVFSVAAVMAIGEYLLQWNPFLLLHADNRLFDTWGSILTRGGVARAEGAFGQPIALGVCLAMAIPFVFASRFSTWPKLGMVAVMAVAIVPTFSRSAMVCGGLAVVISLVFLREGLSSRIRVFALGTLVAVAVVAVPIVLQIFAEAGSEAANSAGYRSSLLSLIPRMSVLGLSPSATRNAYGDLFFANFKSIDSALILLGLTVGWLALVLALVLLAGALVRVVTGRADPATVAVVAAVPALATVAMITQYGMFFWFLAGLAAYAAAQHRAGRSAPDAMRRAPGSGRAPVISSGRTARIPAVARSGDAGGPRMGLDQRGAAALRAQSRR
jgi:hypothetical protein